MELTVDQSGVEKPLAKQVEDAVDLWSCWGWQWPGLPTTLAGAGKQGWGGRLLLLLLLRSFRRLTPTALKVGWKKISD